MRTRTLIKSIISSFAVVMTTGMQAKSIYPMIVFGITYFCFERLQIDDSKTIKVCSSIFGLFGVLSLFQVNVFEEQIGSTLLIIALNKIVITFIGIYYLASLLITLIYDFFYKININNKCKINPTKIFIFSFIFLMVIYLPAWMMEYPSNIGADTLDQLKQITSGTYRNHHPFAHTMWLKALMSFGDDINIKVGIAALLQLIINASVFSYVVKLLYEKTRNIIVALIVFCFYAFYSYNAFLSITLVKDVTHATITCLLLIVLIKYFDEINDKKRNILLIEFTLLSICFCLFRSNGYYAYFIWIIFIIIYSIREKQSKLLLCSFIAVTLSAIIKSPLYHAIGVTDGSFIENISVPVQQIALTLKWGKTLTNEQYELLGRIVEVNRLAESYETFLADPVKNLFNSFGNVDYLVNHKFEYIKLWIGIGAKYPVPYIRAWIDQTSTFFSPRYYGTSFWWGCSNEIGLSSSPILITGQVNKILHLLAYNQHNLPVLGIFHYPAISTWIVIVMFFYGIKNKDFNSLAILIMLIGIWMTLMISCPYNICFRYYYSVVCCIPIVIIYPIYRKKNN